MNMYRTVLFIALLLLGTALAQEPTKQMLELADIAQRYSTNGFAPRSGKESLVNLLSWIATGTLGYGKIPAGRGRNGVSGLDTLVTTTDFNRIMEAGPEMFFSWIDNDVPDHAYWGIKPIDGTVPNTATCPRGAILFMKPGGPSKTFPDGGVFVCSGKHRTVHYNGALTTLSDVDNKFVHRMYAPTNLWIPPPASGSVGGGGGWNVNWGRIPNPPASGFVSITSNAIGTENNQLPSENYSQNSSTPAWAVALIVVGCAVLMALIVLVVQLLHIVKRAGKVETA